VDIDQQDAPLRARAQREALYRLGTARVLGDDDLCGRSAPPPRDRADGHRRAEDGEMFLAYVCKFLCPTLQPRDTVILDNLSSHKVAGVEEAVTAIGAIPLFLPPYSPDLNPIEKFFSKLKARLRKAAKRDIDALWKEIGELLNTVSPSECTNFFAS
jgi:transposase